LLSQPRPGSAGQHRKNSGGLPLDFPVEIGGVVELYAVFPLRKPHTRPYLVLRSRKPEYAGAKWCTPPIRIGLLYDTGSVGHKGLKDNWTESLSWPQRLGAPFKPSVGLSGIMALDAQPPIHHANWIPQPYSLIPTVLTQNL
jgi:hypothetical protein